MVGSYILKKKGCPYPSHRRSTKQLNCPRVLDRSYVESEKARIAAAQLKEAEKVANREVRKLAKEQKAKEATERAEGLQNTSGVLVLPGNVVATI